MTIKDRVKKLCEEKGVSVSKMERECGFANGYVSKLDKSTPNVSKLQIIADYFGVSLDFLTTGQEQEGYYYDKETAEIAQEIYQNKELHMLFDTARDAKAEDLRTFHEMLLMLKRKENHED